MASSPSKTQHASLDRIGPLTASNVRLGSRLTSLSRRWTLQEFTDRHHLVYGDGNIVQGQWPDRNIHSDEEAAKREGLAGAVASAPQVIALITRMMAQSFGSAWLFGGRIDVKMIKPLFVNQLVTTYGEVKGLELAEREDGEKCMRVLCDVRAERLDGVPVMVGTASALLSLDSPSNNES